MVSRDAISRYNMTSLEHQMIVTFKVLTKMKESIWVVSCGIVVCRPSLCFGTETSNTFEALNVVSWS